MICVPNMLRHSEYADTDNNCISQMNHSSRLIGNNDGLIIYPLFDCKGQLMGLLRQYFSQKSVFLCLAQLLQTETASQEIPKDGSIKRGSRCFILSPDTLGEEEFPINSEFMIFADI